MRSAQVCGERHLNDNLTRDKGVKDLLIRLTN